MASGLRIAPVVAALAVVAAASAEAQNSRWAEPYRNAVKAVDGGKCGDAIPLLERAVAADSRAGAQKYVEGVFRIDYFPYYYLALCYVDLQEWEKASQNLDKARATITRQQQAKFAEAESKIKLALNTPKTDPRKAAFDTAVAQAESALSNKQFNQALRQFDAIRAGYATEYAGARLGPRRDEAARGYFGQLFDEGRALATSQKYSDAKAKFQQAEQTLPGQRPVADALADIKRREDEYQQLKTQAIADQNARNFSSARDKLEQARSRDPELFAADNLGARLTEVAGLAMRGAAGGSPAGNAAGGSSAGAANNAGAGNNAGRGGSAAGNSTTGANSGAGSANAGNTAVVDQKALEAQRLTKSAKSYIAQGKYAQAERDYASLMKIDPKNRDAADALAKSSKFKELRDRSAQLSRSSNHAAAQQALVEARSLDPERFNREGLAAALDKLTPSAPSGGSDPARAALQQAVTALLNGRAQDSIAILEPALSKASTNPSLHAYLGVAYATQALSAPKPEDRTRLQGKALEQFKLAKTAQADYQLSTRIVSPAIVSIYASARP